MSRLLVLFAVLALAGGCRTVEDPFQLPTADDAPFYPLELGRFWEYRIDSVIFDRNADIPVRALSRWAKEEVVDTFLDLQGHPWYRIERYERESDTLPWSLKLVVAATIRGSEALRLENDLTFVKLHFPLAPFKNWNGNKYFDPATVVYISGEPVEMFKGWQYQVVESAPDWVSVRQADFENLLERRYSIEKYARDTGLVYRELEILDTQSVEEGIPWEEKAEKGFTLRQTLWKTN